MKYRRLRVPGGTYFFTVVSAGRLPLFSDAIAVSMFHDAVNAIRTKRPFEIDAYVILPDHIHCIWELPDGDPDFSNRWRQIKEAFTRAWLRKQPETVRTVEMIGRGERNVWQRRFWEHLIRDDDDLSAHIEYIHLNPVLHGLARLPRDWPHSSFHDYVTRGDLHDGWGEGATPRIRRGGEP